MTLKKSFDLTKMCPLSDHGLLHLFIDGLLSFCKKVDRLTVGCLFISSSCRLAREGEKKLAAVSNQSSLAKRRVNLRMRVRPRLWRPTKRYPARDDHSVATAPGHCRCLRRGRPLPGEWPRSILIFNAPLGRKDPT